MPLPQPPVELPPNQTDIHVTTEVLPDIISPSAEFINQGSSASNSTSDAENTVVQDVSQSNYNINNNHNNYVQYHNGSRTPVPTWTTDFVYNPRTGDKVVRTGLHIPLGGKSKKLVHKTVKLDNTIRTASACTALLQSNIEVDYEMVPELSQCKYFSQKTVVQKSPVNELKLLRQQMDEYSKLVQQQQETILALKLRLEQMKHEVPQNVTW